MRFLDVVYEQIDDATIILHNRDGESLWRGYAYSALPDAYESYRVEEFWDCEVLDVANGGTMTVDIMIDTDTRRMGALKERNKVMRKRAQEIYTKAMRRSAAIKKKASNIAWELAERAADGIKDMTEHDYYSYGTDAYEKINEAVHNAIDDGLIYYADMWKVIEDYGDVQEIWDFVMQDYSVMESLYDDIYSNLGFLVPEGYEDWEDYINKNTEDDDDEYTARRRRARNM